MRTGVYYKATGGCMGLIQNFSVIPDPPAHANDGSPPETSSLETLPSGGESHQKCWTTSGGECDAADRDRAARGEQELATG
jgi:hypothetical protein